jgi:hypothetical protein
MSLGDQANGHSVAQKVPLSRTGRQMKGEKEKVCNKKEKRTN